MLFHHILAVIIQGLGCYYYEGMDYYANFAWTETGTMFHKLSLGTIHVRAWFLPKSNPWIKVIPDFQRKWWRRYYQLFYLTGYLLSYIPVILYLLRLDGIYSIPVLFGLPTRWLHYLLCYPLVGLLIFWWYQSLTAWHYVYSKIQNVEGKNI